VGFANYRTILEQAGHDQFATVDTIELRGVGRLNELVLRHNAGYKDLRITATAFPSIDPNSLVLIRSADGAFQLDAFSSIETVVEDAKHVLTDYKLVNADGVLRIEGLKLPSDTQFLQIEAASAFGGLIRFDMDLKFSIRSAADTPLDRVSWYWDWDDSEATKVAGMLADGKFRSSFDVVQNSVTEALARQQSRQRLATNRLTFDLGAAWSSESVDFNREASLEMVRRQLQSLLDFPSFDEILLNTRSHTQLSGSFADGPLGLQSTYEYRTQGVNFDPLGLDRAYAPLSLGDSFSESTEGLGELTQWQQGEWAGSCLSESCQFAWRWHRNQTAMQGVDALIRDLESRFPTTPHLVRSSTQ
jgi:Arc/MetJ-type ribon-helix-helix transcriptional regulator